jgi:hypothetical protein
MKYAIIQPKTATKVLIHLINTVERSDKVSQLLKDLCLIFKGMQFLILLMIRANLFIVAV